jgi:L-threonylcarbamoyladenylate synthase
VTAQILPDDETGWTAAAVIVRDGGIVALPTDTVYGIGVALDTPGGIERLFHVKQRPPDKGVMLLLGDATQAATFGVMTPAANALADACWPGGLTLVLAQRADVTLPAVLTGGARTIGLRVPDHATPRALARLIGPLPVTSANVSGQPEARDAEEIQAILGDAIEAIIDGGPATGGPASTVVDVSTDRPTILREGAITTTRIAAILDAAGIAHDLRTV